MSIEAMKQALKAPEDTESYWVQVADERDARLLAILKRIDKLEGDISNEFLEITDSLRLQRGEPEPVAWVCEGFGKAKHAIDYIQKDVDALPIGTMLYTALPKRELQELTNEQIDSACLSYRHDFGLMSVAQQDYIRFQAKEWAEALAKARGSK
jgi:hypothetical protein